ncbi:MAG: hypothetical protein ACKVJK_24330 [Methylophagaceae bacterium]|jgi:hypothetical protein|tara:strand:- start:175 stop:462 length:288 start_codon:yes stop_codon:yes gene_type:complete
MDIKDIPAGESWGCRFRTTTFLDKEGTPVQANSLSMGQAHPGTPGEYEGIGVIQVRDTEAERVQLQDVETLRVFTVEFKDCWDIDTIEWTEAEEA